MPSFCRYRPSGPACRSSSSDSGRRRRGYLHGDQLIARQLAVDLDLAAARARDRDPSRAAPICDGRSPSNAGVVDLQTAIASGDDAPRASPGGADRACLPTRDRRPSSRCRMRGPATASAAAFTQPLSIARRSSGPSLTPMSALRISSGRRIAHTRRSRESSNVPREPSATRMNTGLPNGATPSSRSAPGTRPA